MGDKMKTILITGSSTGIGRAAAEFFADKGWNVAATMRTPKKNSLRERKNLKKYRLDVTDKDSIKKAVSQTIKDFGKIDVLLNNAGYGAMGPLEAATDNEIKRQFDVNLFGLLDVTRAVLPNMRRNKSGIIINISSVGGRMTFPLLSLYHGTKFAVEGISESMNYELNPLGIKVRLVEPGGVKTDFAGRSMNLFNNKLKAYEPIVSNLRKAWHNDSFVPGTARGVAKVIYKAATSKRKKMRYVSGYDAKFMLSMRKLIGTNGVMNIVKKMFKI